MLSFICCTFKLNVLMLAAVVLCSRAASAVTEWKHIQMWQLWCPRMNNSKPRLFVKAVLRILLSVHFEKNSLLTSSKVEVKWYDKVWKDGVVHCFVNTAHFNSCRTTRTLHWAWKDELQICTVTVRRKIKKLLDSKFNWTVRDCCRLHMDFVEIAFSRWITGCNK